MNDKKIKVFFEQNVLIHMNKNDFFLLHIAQSLQNSIFIYKKEKKNVLALI